jgi:hypothetical protein
VCVRFYRRFDGTILTSDCPEGAKRKRRRRVAAVAGAAAGAGMLASLWMNHRVVQVQGGLEAVQTQGETTHAGPETMGSVSPAIMGTAAALPEVRTPKK